MELDLENDDGSDELNSVGSDSKLEELTKEDSPAGKYILLAASPNNAVWSCSVRSFGKIARTYHQSRTGDCLTNQWLQVFDDKQKERISSKKDPSNSSHPSRNLSPEGQDVSKFPLNVNFSPCSTMPSDSSPTSPPQPAPNPDLTTSMIQAPNRQALSKSNRRPSQLTKSSLPISITNATPSNELSNPAQSNSLATQAPSNSLATQAQAFTTSSLPTSITNATPSNELSNPAQSNSLATQAQAFTTSSLPTSITNATSSNELSNPAQSNSLATQAPSKSLATQNPSKPNQILSNPAQALPKVKGVIVKTLKGMFLKMSDSQVLVPITGLQRPKKCKDLRSRKKRNNFLLLFCISLEDGLCLLYKPRNNLE